ncbi:MAG: Asp-tRNA(Asn)/Glu-tRNA(Gln) amidotransferase subunit GatB [Candidatus Paceibacterota bacterium]|nr:Asp-tRNA(Asn)/Glu-tRNA(Gln) amidotransferase subunit GatB [Candidatus Paceibacterota bacterium]
MEYKTTIGLEIHAELRTKTKMFCHSKNDPEEKKPNVNICPVCLGYPGTLPVINKEAVKHVLRVGKALGANLADFTEFDRKNYFYPDIPKGYQISQYKYPLVSGGELAGVKITRVHLEEDTARSSHEKGDYSLVDFNRAGVPLMELVTEPVITSAEQAVNFARELQLLLRYLGVSYANMEKGEMRVEANVSVSKTDTFGTKCEVKNLNSFRTVEKAIAFEVARHIDILESGGKVVQETRGWNEQKQETYSQRNKENAHDYRYFPDPDLPKLKLSDVPELLSAELPELPAQKRVRFDKEYGVKEEDREMYIFDQKLGDFFEETIKIAEDKKLAALISNYITSDLAGLQKNNPDIDPFKNITAQYFSDLIKMANGGELSSRGAKDALAIMFKEGGDPKKIAEEKGLIQKNDEGELIAMVQKIIAENEKVAAEYRAGKEASIMFLVGQGMKASKGSANPQVLKKLFETELKK